MTGTGAEGVRYGSDAAGAQVTRRPVARAQVARRGRRRSSSARGRTVAADGDRHVRRARLGRVKNSRSPGARSSALTELPTRYCSRTVARQRHAVLREDVLREAAAVEAVGIGAAVAVRRAAQRERRPDQRVAVDAADAAAGGGSATGCDGAGTSRRDGKRRGCAPVAAHARRRGVAERRGGRAHGRRRRRREQARRLSARSRLYDRAANRQCYTVVCIGQRLDTPTGVGQNSNDRLWNRRCS